MVTWQSTTDLCTKNLMCVEVWFRTGTKDKRRYIPIHSLWDVLGAKICRALPGYHAITGCDSVSSLSRFGKKSTFDMLCSSVTHQGSLSQLGARVNIVSTTKTGCEKFMCCLYTKDTKLGSMDEARYRIFCQKGQKNEILPPTSDSLALGTCSVLTTRPMTYMVTCVGSISATSIAWWSWMDDHRRHFATCTDGERIRSSWLGRINWLCQVNVSEQTLSVCSEWATMHWSL